MCYWANSNLPGVPSLRVSRTNMVMINPDIVDTTRGISHITADRADESGPSIGDSQWVLTGHVRADMAQGQLRCDTATIRIVDSRIASITTHGSPALFQRPATNPPTPPASSPHTAGATGATGATGAGEQKADMSSVTVRGHAQSITYDAVHDQVQFSGDSWFTDGCNEITSQLVDLQHGHAAHPGQRDAGQQCACTRHDTQHAPGNPVRCGDRTAMTRLAARSLTKSYRSRQVVRDLSLEISTGEVVGLLGPNGAGKTTAFYMIVGLIAADGGSILLDERDLTSLSIDQRARLGIGYLPQEASVFRKLSVADNILAILELRAELDRAGREQRLEELLEELRIGHVRNTRGLALSGGERRRVEIARALAAEPRFMLLDEPFAGVDPLSVLDIQRIIRELAGRGIGVLITDHNVRETLGVCGRAYIVDRGMVIASGSAEQVLANPQVREVYLGQSFRL